MSLPVGQHDVGRMSDCWLTLDDELASRYHARFYVSEESVELADLESRNGTYLNGERITERVTLADGDRVRIGRELIAFLTSDVSEIDEDSDLRRTLAPGEDTHFPSLISQLVEKSLKVGKLKEAERYANALTGQITGTSVALEHPSAQATITCLLGLAERTNSGVWIDKLFKLLAAQSWIIDDEIVERIHSSLDRIPRIPGTGIAEYERRLRSLEREGQAIPAGLTSTIAELADSYGSR